MQLSIRPSVTFLAVCLFTFPPLSSLLGAAQVQVAAGYATRSERAAPGGAFVGGFDLLPGGAWLLFDGTRVVEVDPGSGLRELYRPPSPVFGAFVARGPDGSKVYFGESSTGEITEIDRVRGTSRRVMRASMPFDLAFDPDGRAFLQWSPGFGQGSFVSHLDLIRGQLTDVIRSAEASGPIAFSAAGDLSLIVPFTQSYPPPPDSYELRRFSRVEVDAALQTGPVPASSGALVARLDGGFGLAVDTEGDLFISDASSNRVSEVDAVTGAERVVYQGPNFVGATFLRYLPGQVGAHVGAFEPYQPGCSGTLRWIESDFFSFNDVRSLEPSRPVLACSAPSPVPTGPLSWSLDGGVPGGVVLLLLGAAAAGPEQRFGNVSAPAGLFLGMDLRSSLRLLVLPLDSQGRLDLAGLNPGLGGIDLALQGIVAPAAAGPYLGTSTRLDLTLD